VFDEKGKAICAHIAMGLTAKEWREREQSIRDHFAEYVLPKLDLVLDVITLGLWSKVRGEAKVRARVKGR